MIWGQVATSSYGHYPRIFVHDAINQKMHRLLESVPYPQSNPANENAHHGECTKNENYEERHSRRFEFKSRLSLEKPKKLKFF